MSHAGDTYRMYNPKTVGITTTRDIYWLNKMPNDVKIDKSVKIESDDGSDDKTKKQIVQVTENQENQEAKST